jgi:hypothetical protein
VAEYLTPLGISYDAGGVAAMRRAREPLGGVRANAAFCLWEVGADPDAVIDEVARYELTSKARGQKAVEFLLHPIWRSYISCYVEGLALCWSFVGGRPDSAASSPSSSRREIWSTRLRRRDKDRHGRAVPSTAARGRGAVVPSMPCPSVPAICPAGRVCPCRDPTRAFWRRLLP